MIRLALKFTQSAQWQSGWPANTRSAKWTFHQKCAHVVATAGLFPPPRWDGRSQMLAFHTCCFHGALPPHGARFFNDTHFVPLCICMQGEAQLCFPARLGHLIRQASLTVHREIIKQCMSDTCDREFPQIQGRAATVELMEYWDNVAAGTINTAVNDDFKQLKTNKPKGQT